MITEALRLINAKWQRVKAEEAAKTRVPREKYLSLDGARYLRLHVCGDGMVHHFECEPRWTKDWELPLYPIEQ